jgi:SWI/SNF-related matrix-associated actin-dependent regulator 1 of chromatin subfamily A
MDYSGNSNTQELHYTLQKSFMIRRVKKDVLDQLPDKRRQKIEVTVDAKKIKEIA